MDDQGGASSRSVPLLQSSSSFDKMELHRAASRPVVPSLQGGNTSASPTSRAMLTRPRPEIVLRWKRFALLVVLGAVLISVLTVVLWVGIPLTELGPEVSAADAEAKVALFNSYSGVIMGFVESGVSQLLGYLFPVFIVYLHNLKWSRLDDPATRPISKIKKVSLLLFFPIVMVAIGNSLSAVQTNQSGGGGGEGDDARQRRLEARTETRDIDQPPPETSALDNTLLRTLRRGGGGGLVLDRGDASGGDDDQLQRVAAGTRIAVGFALRDWRDELPAPEAASSSVRLTRADRSTVRRSTSGEAEIVSPDTSVDLLLHGLRALEHQANELRVDLSIPDAAQRLDALASLSSATPQELLQAVANALESPGGRFNTSAMVLQLSREQLHPHVVLQSVTLELPLVTDTASSASVSCGLTDCVSRSADPLLRLRSLVAASRFAPVCRRTDVEACEADRSAAFLYSSSVSGLEDATSASGVEYTLTLTFARLAWAFEGDSSLQLCASPSEDPCAALTLELPHSRRHLLLNALLSPATLLSKTSPARPLRLVEIVQPPVVDRAHHQRSTVTLLTPRGIPATREAKPTVEAFGSFVRANRLVGTRETMASTLRVTALLFLFQDAIVAPSAPSPAVAWQRHLLATATNATTGTSGKDYEVFVSNTRFGAIATWVACGILFVLSALVLVLPNARARLEPPKGGNARAERFVAVQTEEVYPNLVYKKRFRIGKTGEKIKFREFAVETVTLHHKMEEDEQIQL